MEGSVTDGDCSPSRSVSSSKSTFRDEGRDGFSPATFQSKIGCASFSPMTAEVYTGVRRPCRRCLSSGRPRRPPPRSGMAFATRAAACPPHSNIALGLHAFEIRRALFEERSHSFLHVLGRREEAEERGL